MMNRLSPWIAALLCFVTPAVALAQQPQGPGYGPYMWNSGWHGWFFGPITMILVIAVAVVVVVLLVRWLGGPSHGSLHHQPPTRAPLDILKECAIRRGRAPRPAASTT